MRYLCIHGHFYQPPRENPWLESIELQDSAYPYHDWNERINAECYAPNAATRILDTEGHIKRIVNNYSQINFNFGPTLLAWAKAKAPGLHQLVIEADQLSRAKFSGHGSAIAQAYNHMIMPLATRRDQYTQAYWGIEDFKARFGRDPEGMWLPETAVNLETLEVLAELGIKFTVLAQNQARLVRRIGAVDWVDVSGGRIDPTRPYVCPLPSGKSIAIFFYDGPISRAVAFEGLLNNGEVFAQRLLGAYWPNRDWRELAHIATDGESYGHHHRYGEMALAYALHHIERNGLARLTNYGEFLELQPPTHEVEIFEGTAWSCAHGVGRWNSNCGCNSGGHPGWNQEWRAPLRAALDWLRDEVGPQFEKRGLRYLRDPWDARNDYIQVVLDRTPATREAFLAKHANRKLEPHEQVEVWKLFELQRHAMLMYTSCGWFFDELTGIETVQVIQYAGRVVQLAQELFESRAPEIHYASRGIELPSDIAEGSLESRFLDRLRFAKSNKPEHGDGAAVYEKFVKPTFVDLRKVGAHYAISSLFKDYPEETRIHCYRAVREDLRSADTGKLSILVGRARLTSDITQESCLLTFGVLHFGDHNIHGGVREFRGEAEYERVAQEAMQAFSRADIPEVIRTFDRGFGLDTYSIKSLFRDEQRDILGKILTSTLAEAEGVFRQLYEHHAPLMRFLIDLKTPLPKAFRATAEYAMNSHLRNAMDTDDLDTVKIKSLLQEARAGGVELDSTTLEFTVRKTLERRAEKLKEEPLNHGLLKGLRRGVELLDGLPFPVTLWSIQNAGYHVLQSTYPAMDTKAGAGDTAARAWVEDFKTVARKLSLRID